MKNKYHNEQLHYIDKYIERLERENTHLKEKLKLYEEPDDMTLIFMWCDEKAKDKIKDLQQKIDKAIDFITEWEKETKEKRSLEVSMLDLLYIKDILGGNENDTK